MTDRSVKKSPPDCAPCVSLRHQHRFDIQLFLHFERRHSKLTFFDFQNNLFNCRITQFFALPNTMVFLASNFIFTKGVVHYASHILRY